MEKDVLSERKTAIEKQYDEYSQKKIDLEDEMKRLQGEHRLISELLQETEPKRLRKAKVENATD